MDSENLTQILITWGYPGLFLASFVAGSTIPFASEVVLFGILKFMGAETFYQVLPWLLCATVGNTLGGMTCYLIGHLGKVEWVEKYLHVKKEKVDRMQVFLQGKGSLMAFFCFLPAIGTAIAVALGFMRSNLTLTTSSMFTGKFLRYCVIWAVAVIV